MDLPNKALLTRCDSDAHELGTIETLHRETAKNEIDGVWWNNLTDTLQSPEDEPDHHWKWKAIVSQIQNKPYYQAKCVRSQNLDVQAAMLLRVDAKSAVEDEASAVHVHMLATAPRNRDYLVREPHFRGCGTALVKYAIALSYSLGWFGRVNLIPIANEDFYTNFGFQPTEAGEGADVLFELESNVAIVLLKKWGLIDG